MMQKTLALIAGLVLVSGLAVAASHDGVLTADHPLYSAKMAGEEAVEGMAPNETEEAEAKVNHAEKRANEANKLADEGKDDMANDTANAYAEKMQEVNDLGSTVSDLAQKQKIDELVATATQHHAEILSTVYEKVPEQARQGIEKALNESVKGFQQATNAMESRGEDTGDMNMSAKIPSNVRDQIGIDMSDIRGPPEDTGGQPNSTGGPQ